MSPPFRFHPLFFLTSFSRHDWLTYIKDNEEATASLRITLVSRHVSVILSPQIKRVPTATFALTFVSNPPPDCDQTILFFWYTPWIVVLLVVTRLFSTNDEEASAWVDAIKAALQYPVFEVKKVHFYITRVSSYTFTRTPITCLPVAILKRKTQPASVGSDVFGSWRKTNASYLGIIPAKNQMAGVTVKSEHFILTWSLLMNN